MTMAFALQWSINGFHNNLDDLHLLVRDLSPTVIALQEVQRTKRDVMNNTLSGGYKWTLKRNQNIYHSVAIGIQPNIPFKQIELNASLPIVAVRVDCPFPVSIVSFYIPCGKNL